MIGMCMTVKTEHQLQDGGAPEYVCHDRTAWRCAVFVGKRYGNKRIPTKKCCPCTVNIACHVKQPSKTMSFGGTLSSRWRCWKISVLVVPTATKRILRRRFPGTCEMVGQVFKFVWRLRWKINVVCKSLSSFVSLQLRFVTYLLTFSRKRILLDVWPWMEKNRALYPYRDRRATWILDLLISDLIWGTIPGKFSRVTA